MKIAKLLVDAGVCKSNREAIELIKSGSIKFNSSKITEDMKYIYFIEDQYIITKEPVVGLEIKE